MSDRIVKAIGPYRTRAREFPEPVIRLSARERSAILDSLKPKHLSQREQKDLFLHVRKIRRDLRVHRQMGLNEKPNKDRITRDLKRAAEIGGGLLEADEGLRGLDEGAIAMLATSGWGDEDREGLIDAALRLKASAMDAEDRIAQLSLKGPVWTNAEYSAMAATAALFHKLTGRRPSRYPGSERNPYSERQNRQLGPYFPPFAKAVLGPEFPDSQSFTTLIDEVQRGRTAAKRNLRE